MLKQIKGERRGDMKRQLNTDGLKRVKVGLYKFYELNDTMPKSLRIPLTHEYYVFALFFQNTPNIRFLIR